MLKLYNYPDCPFCQKVRVVLAEKDLEYEKTLVDLRKQDQKAPEFLQLNPYGKVPVLVDEDTVVYDSTIINEYLDEEYPLPPLMPEDSQGKAQVRTLEDYCDNSFIPPRPCSWPRPSSPRASGTNSASSRRAKSSGAASTSCGRSSTATNTWSATSSRSRTRPSRPE